MKTGRELDALVAERVMGWKRAGADSYIRPAHRASLDFPGETINDWDAKGPHDWLVAPNAFHRDQYVAFCGCESTVEIPAYSTDIAVAWDVVVAMRAKGWVVSINNECARDCVGVVFERDPSREDDEDERPPVICHDDTVALAVCRAALQACGVK